MKIERDFFATSEGVTYRWTATVEGKQYRYQHYQCGDFRMRVEPPLRFIEIEAQRQIMHAIQKDLFGERTL